MINKYLVEKKPHPIGSGIQKIYKFENGYGASVVRFKLPFGEYGSYTNSEDEWELAVIKFVGKSNSKFNLDYGTSITDDVMGHLSTEEVEKILNKIRKLKWP